MGAGVQDLRTAVFHRDVAGAAARCAAGPAGDETGWLSAVAYAGTGRFGHALVAAGQLRTSGAPPWDALAATVVGSVRRQLGEHAEGQRADEQALRLAGDSAAARFDALVGLAADAVGLCDAPLARRRLAAAEAVVDPDPADPWRPVVRLGWVRTEIALIGGDPTAAQRCAAGSVCVAEDANAPRHLAKSLLFLGVARSLTDPDGAAAILRRAADLTYTHDLLPIRWPTLLVLGRLSGDRQALLGAREAVRGIAADLGEPDGARWLGRPDVAQVVAPIG